MVLRPFVDPRVYEQRGLEEGTSPLGYPLDRPHEAQPEKPIEQAQGPYFSMQDLGITAESFKPAPYPAPAQLPQEDPIEKRMVPPLTGHPKQHFRSSTSRTLP
jgi:hypothetical protein